MSNETIADLLIIIIGFSLFITIIILFARGYMSSGGGSITTMAGATAELYTEDKNELQKY